MATTSAMAKVLAKANEKSGKVVRNAVLNGGTLTAAYTPQEAADKFIEVLHSSIESSGLTAEAMNAISDIEASAPVEIAPNVYSIDINFAGDMSRQSLAPEYPKFKDGISNIAKLLNHGVDKQMNPVYGIWPGHGHTMSKTIIKGAHFVESAVNQFMADYGQTYHVVDIKIGDDF